MNDTLQTWLLSQECYRVLKLCAGKVINKAESIPLILDDTYLNRTDYLDAVTNQLWDFVRDQGDKLAQKATALLVSGDDDGFMEFIKHEFIDFKRDHRRAVDPFYAYYRHVRTVLSKEEGIRFEPKGREGSYYAYSDSPTLIFLPEHLILKDYHGWLAPNVVFCEIHEKSAILRLARHCWDESLKVLPTEYLLPVRELVKYVVTVYPLVVTESTESSLDIASGEDDIVLSSGDKLITSVDSRDGDAWKRQLPVMVEKDIVNTLLEDLARDCCHELSYKQKRLILMKLEDDLTYEEICTLLGEKTSNLHYHLKKGIEIIRQKWSLWGPPLLKQFADVDEEEFFLFYDMVIFYCKKDEACREYKRGPES